MSIILDNLEESIVIFNQDSLEFINDTFLDLFRPFFKNEITFLSKKEIPCIPEVEKFSTSVFRFFR